MECELSPLSQYNNQVLSSFSFRWAALQLDALAEGNGYSALTTTPEYLPPTLEETYQRILRRIPLDHKKESLRLLQFLTYSARPLGVEEVIDTFSVLTKDALRLDPSYRMPSLRKIQQSCSYLIEAGQYDTIRLAHFSVREYLTSGQLDNEIQPYFTEKTARAEIAKVCLVYLLHLDKVYVPQSLRKPSALEDYSARYWMSHASVTEELDQEVSTLSMRLLLNPIAFRNVCRLYNPDKPWRNRHTTPLIGEDVPLTPLYYASLGGLSRTIRLLLDAGEDINTPGGKYGTPLHAACARGHQSVVELLIARGANLDAENTIHFTARDYAMMRGHEQIVQLLLANGATPSMHEDRPLVEYSKTASEKKEHMRNETENLYGYTKEGTVPDSEHSSMRPSQVADTNELHSRAPAPATQIVQTQNQGLVSKFTDYGTAQGLGGCSTDAINLSTSAGKGVAIPTSQKGDKMNSAEGCGALNSKMKELINGFAEELSGILRPEISVNRSRDRVSKVLPGLLESFAFRLRQNVEEKMNPDTMLFTLNYGR